MTEANLEQMRDLESISQYRDEQQRNLQIALALKEKVENEVHEICKEIMTLQRQIKDLEIRKLELKKALNKSKLTCSTLSIEADRAKQKYFNTKI